MPGGGGESQMTAQSDADTTLPPLPKVNKSMMWSLLLQLKTNKKAKVSSMTCVKLKKK